MKKLLSIFLVAVLVMACLPVTALAAGNATISASSAVAEPGDTVPITYTVSGDGFANVDEYSITCEAPLTIASISGVVADPSTGRFAYASWENTNSISFTVTFNVPADIAAGDYSVSVDNAGFVSDADLNDLDVSIAGGVVTIEGEPEPPVTEHVHSWSDWKVTTPATCTEAGVETRTCACGETETRAIDALGHTWGEWTETKAATCTEAGVETRTCSVCGETETREIAVIDHVYGGWTFCGTDAKHEHEKVCSVCGDKIGPEACNDQKQYEQKSEDGKKIVEYWQCVDCGHEFTVKKDAPVVPDKPVDPNLDDVPKTGDITGQVVMAGAAALVCMMAAVAFIFKRKAAK